MHGAQEAALKLRESLRHEYVGWILWFQMDHQQLDNAQTSLSQIMMDTCGVLHRLHNSEAPIEAEKIDEVIQIATRVCMCIHICFYCVRLIMAFCLQLIRSCFKLHLNVTSGCLLPKMRHAPSSRSLMDTSSGRQGFTHCRK